ncbi:SH3 domain-containing protein [Rhodobacter sp. Har01]|uniref:COG3650 family protein n=1 Tax=Rhodobacter sp. Har01 TaxID=2883999 RepID=UPI001D084C13|nr:SH3 domain-containing protein [Rhodobacter sp. Har01]MCB6178057.1 SH3 domain-containing protein [Rhodobacter sp. Har01]
MRSCFILAALIACPATGLAEDLPALFDVTGVARGDVLNIRAQPSARAPVVDTLPPDARGIEVVAQIGAWGAVNTGEGTGYASMTYLKPAPGPGWASLEVPLRCVGTEPFWGLDYAPEDQVLTLSLPDEGEREMPVTATWPALPWSPLVGLGMAEGTAVLRPEECSDGMSDRTFGLALDLFLTGAAPMHFAGCCSLTD